MDCHVKSGKALYSVPSRFIGQQVTVRTAGDIVQIFHDDTVVATHVLHLCQTSHDQPYSRQRSCS